MTPEQRKRYHQGVAAGQPANYNAAWHIGTPKRDVVDKGWMGLKNTPSEIRLSGWVQFALFHDFQGNALATTQEFSAGAVLVPTLKRPSTGVDVGNSFFFFEFRHVFKGQQKRKNYPRVTHVLFEMDLGGTQSPTGSGLAFVNSLSNTAISPSGKPIALLQMAERGLRISMVARPVPI